MDIYIHSGEIKNLINKANAVKDRAYAPYSQKSVGVCLKGASGAYYSSCNVENESYAASVCAERAAICKAVSEAETQFAAMAIISSDLNPAVPCGVCRQMISEMCPGDMPVICANRSGKYQIYKARDLLPQAFASKDMK